MPQTTTAINACDAVIVIDNDAGTLTDVSGSTNTVSLTFEINMGEAHTFDGDYPIRTVCGKSASMEMTTLYTTTADEGWDLIKGWYHAYDGASRTVRVEPEGTGSGNDRYEGEWTLTGYNFELVSSEGGPILVTSSYVNDGVINLLEIGT